MSRVPPSPSALSARQTGLAHLGVLTALVVLAIGLTTAWWLISQPPRVERRPPPEVPPPLVDVTIAERRAAAPQIHGYGRVVAEREIRLASRVAGRLEAFAPGVVPGRVVEAGAEIAHLDDADLRLALREAEATLAQAEAALAMERGEQQRARSEYQSFGRELPAERRALVLREPQLRSAEAEVERARAARDRARLDLDRATLVAPWRGMIQERLLGSGSQIASGTELVHLIDVARFWVRASLPGETLPWLDIGDDGRPGAETSLTSRGWPAGSERLGRLVSALPSLEADGLQAQLLVAVEDPLSLDGEGPALRLGDLVRLEFTAIPRADLFVLPATALRPGDLVWRLDDEDRLRRARVEVMHRGEQQVLIRSGLDDGDRVVTSNLGQPREGMRLRPRPTADEHPTSPVEEPAS